MKPLLMTQDDVQVPSSQLIDVDHPSTTKKTLSNSKTHKDTSKIKNVDGTPHLNYKSNQKSTSKQDTDASTHASTHVSNETKKNKQQQHSIEQNHHPDNTPATQTVVLTDAQQSPLQEEGSIYINIAKVLLVLVVILALFYVAYWVLQNVYKIDIVEQGKQWLGMKASSPVFSPSNTSSPIVETTDMSSLPLFSTPSSNHVAPHADGVHNMSTQGSHMKNALSDKSVSTLLDLMANVAE